MKKVKIGNQGFEGSVISLGIMRMDQISLEEAKEVVQTALDYGIDYFDHADIYGDGESERIFGRAVKEMGIPRDSLLIQSKGGIVKGGMYDFSKEHIISAVEGSLKRLQTDYLDAFLLHRPDALMEPEEVAEAFDLLEKTGKVRHFGVSNHNPMQIELLKTKVKQPLLINQLQLSVTHHPMIDAGLNVNRVNDLSIVRDGSILDYSRITEMTIQPWSPFQIGNEKRGVLIGHPDYRELNEVLDRMAEEKGVAQETIAIAWLLRHPARMQPIIGSMNPKRIAAVAKAPEVTLSREEWYELYRAGGYRLP
ncbi:aldo/keto reductase [Jeotgalibaca caeni]|uniref:aldo/keto reductase n=1 Tax=Jeotgalibaca caeni TaxID=3028623 RepID=UPI00237E3BCC|nr:aldo/keto reductase [Jeotgalibaca caeni]MDE1550035.1 aldo/keto reductase [Jeotgalibaca caeni]